MKCNMDKNDVNQNIEVKSTPPKPKRLWLNFLVVFIILGVLLYLAFKFAGDINNVIFHIKNANIWYILLALLGVFIFSVINSLSGHSIFVFTKAKINFTNSFLIQNMEMFWNGITPFSTGGAPIQAYYYVKAGAEPNKATSVMLSNFIIYQTVLTLLSILAIIFFHNDLSLALQKKNVGWYIITIGFSINTVLFFLSVFFSFSSKTSLLLNKIITLICKIKPLRNKKDKWVSKATAFTNKFQESLRFLFKRKRLFFVSLTLKIVAQLVFFFIPVLVYLSLGYNIFDANEMFYIMSAVLLASSTMMWVPLPGASGGTETAFIILLSLPFLYLGESQIVALMLVWRFITYYFGMIYGGINYLILKRRIRS